MKKLESVLRLVFEQILCIFTTYHLYFISNELRNVKFNKINVYFAQYIILNLFQIIIKNN